MSEVNEVLRRAGFIHSEANGTASRETVTVTVAADTRLGPGRVMGKLSATGKHVPYDNVGADGSEVAAGILYAELENTTDAPVDFDGVVVNRNAEVRKADLDWGAVDAAGQLAGLADLYELGIKALDE